MCLGKFLASRNLLHCGQCTLVSMFLRVPGLPVSGRDMWEEDLRVMEGREESSEEELMVEAAASSDLRWKI